MVKTRSARLRRAKQNALVEALEDAAASRASDQRVLGTSSVEKAAEAGHLFNIDRTGDTKIVFDGRISKLRTKRKVRRSEKALLVNEKVTAMRVGKFRKAREGAGEVRLLGRRLWKKRERKRLESVRSFDLWAGQTMQAKIDSGPGGGKDRERETRKNLKAILPPKEGESVNPTVDAHQQWLGEAAAKIAQTEESRDHLSEQMQVDEASDASDTFEKGENMGSDENEDDSDIEQIVKPATGERKTRTERNKERKKKKAETLRRRNMRKERRNARYQKLPDILEEIDKQSPKCENDVSKKDLAAPVHVRLAGEKVPTEADTRHVPLSDDLASSLRQAAMPVKNTMLSDRFLSFQRRGLIVPTAATIKQARREKRERAEYERTRAIRKIRNGRGSRSVLSYWVRKVKKKIR